jgi:hypothetical protein
MKYIGVLLKIILKFLNTIRAVNLEGIQQIL